MKYRLTPFHIGSLYFLFETIISVIDLIKLGSKSDLGSLFVFYYLGIFLAIIVIDFLMQVMFFQLKGSLKLLYLTQIILLICVYVWYFR